MRQSKLFTKTQKDIVKDETSANAQLLLKAGFIHKEMAGVYSFLPLGLRVIKKIENIIRQEMNALGGIEMKTSIIQAKEVWEKSNRWSDAVVDVWFKTKLKNDSEIGLSFTNEEAYANILKEHINSYKDLPVYPYDFKEIFRNETRSKSGILRGREFCWKALYSFSKDESEHNDFYERAKQAYKNIFNKVGIGEVTYLTFASGGTFSKFSHEFQTICDAGEDIIYADQKKKIAINKEVFSDGAMIDLKIKKEDLAEKKAIEVGNIFTLGTKFSEPLDLKYKNEQGESKFVFMGSYGIGLSRLMGTVVEVLHDEKGIVWPKEVAPFAVHLIELGDSEKVKIAAGKIYQELSEKNIEVLYDDRPDKTAGEKFADCDLLGMPYRVVVSARTLEKDSIELKERKDKETKLIKLDEIEKYLK